MDLCSKTKQKLTNVVADMNHCNLDQVHQFVCGDDVEEGEGGTERLRLCGLRTSRQLNHG